MVTKEEALTANHFHEEHSSTPTVGPRGGKKWPKVYSWRRNGGTQTWVTRPDQFRVPIKFGLRTHGYLTQDNARDFHTAATCPLRGTEGEVY